jgi:hypothetical protein
MTTYYVTVSYYDDCPDTEEYGTQEEAAEAYTNSIDAAHDKAMGDVSRVSYGTTKANKNTRIASYEFD